MGRTVYLKSHFWSNRAYADYDALEAAAIDAWRHAVAPHYRICHTLMNDNAT